MIRGNLTKIQRQKIVALVTIEVHARDVIEKMIKSGCGDVTAFEWLSQLRLYWDKVCKKQNDAYCFPFNWYFLVVFVTLTQPQEPYI